MITDPKELIKSLKESVAAIDDASGDPTALIDSLTQIAKSATEGALSLRKANAMKSSQAYDETGFEPLVQDLWCDSISCCIMSRQNTDGSRNYIVKAPLDGDENVAIGALDYAPDVTALSKILMDAGLRSERIPLGYEWAINFNGTNDYPGNFNCKELRDCAVDELILQEGLDSFDTDGSILVLFELHAEGAEVDGSEDFICAREWAEERGLPVSQDAAAEAPRA